MPPDSTGGDTSSSDPSMPSDTLVVGPDVRLILEGQELTVQDGSAPKKPRFSCCGLSPQPKPSASRTVPLYNVLWAELSDYDLEIQYVIQVSKDKLRPSILRYTIAKSDLASAETWASTLLSRAYARSQLRKRIKVLINPFGGAGRAWKHYRQYIEPIFAAAKCVLDVQETEYMAHAVDIAANLDVDAWDVVACCSGDGVAHEVFNGLGKKRDARRALNKVAVVQLPCGTGNALSWNLNGTDSPSTAALGIVKGIRTPMDLVSITQGEKRILSFLSQAVGVVADCDIGTEHLRWMGDLRFTWGFLVRILGKTVYPFDVALQVEIDNKEGIREAYRKYAGDGGSSDDINQDATTPSDVHVQMSPSETDEQGLPPLKYGTIHDKLPDAWSLTPSSQIGNFYAGNLAYMSANANFFPAALPADGCLDLVSMSFDLPRMTSIKLLGAVGQGTFFDQKDVRYRKIGAYRMIPRPRKKGEELLISIDGEKVPGEPYQAEVHRGLGMVLSRNGTMYEAQGPQ